ncbi:toll/interleukin-1 receptor domain-containing protein [Priestia megaterium]|uniref:TIR domain protein n=1 Tax=Priestia megaterium (strain ATCC 14581 / DSM 32 / CCUG 1817 / JCM 2506 / NBRC 15308 / NCIMB 9376 / NCTC 10342 / NRRL B-14308 / VKM B-512 / Ford 19) TaxID=1348623 RepID=A0A0B6AD42_PRIM2|nr:toll/interleukin-1 receptor domain-containing protein [Priestia megaterium]AJI21431.1 TIR domain protein [Priestia megaterium NBRC 15308 = ATCC 14581]KFM97515.1 TIR domain protein [Priestia megaterium]KGJ73862.1 hypothetical protein BMT_05610 [Priestia megaterium NBRC 15308 = ATCC 14581]MDR4231328.1 toll/interleukin-1 receptor domain-containing protein [Priestia megaterium]MED3807594.1 toll/interleukin-1 receptor domain-containing protein [Priestia megaterium]
MIFISHQHKDKEIVSPIAYQLEEIYGEDNVFYDDWSIKPGENIIERMNEGLERCQFFFYFITENSLKSPMVTLEWTNALKERSAGIQFIPVRAEDINVPKIISALSYLDMSTNGIETTLRQIQDIVSPGVEKKKKDIPTFNNLQAYVTHENFNSFYYVIRAKRFFEPSGTIVAATNLDQTEGEFKALNAPMYNSGFSENALTLNNTEVMNAFTINFPGGIRKGFDFEASFNFKEKENRKSGQVYLFHLKEGDKLEPIELITVISKDQIPQPS